MWLANAEKLDGVAVVREHRRLDRLDELDLDVVREGRTGRRRRGAWQWR